jgi:bifunctional non-homologous end joining protein LigD
VGFIHSPHRNRRVGRGKKQAMPKASMDPVEERPATRSEDHPLEYAEFEGVIPRR